MMKVAFFRKCDSFFQISKTKYSKNYPELEIKTVKSYCEKFKFQGKDSFFGIFFFEIRRGEKQIALTETKPPLAFRLERTFEKTNFPPTH